MSLNHYKLYLEQVFQLAETIVIKSEDSAVFINNRIAFLHGDNAVNPIDKTSWKYYLNLAGKYHPLDQKITITSLDTLQEIEFSASSLTLHTATAKAYQHGSRYYRELLTQYPEQEQFILGALYPIDLVKSTTAHDFEVIGYPTHLIETNEESLINNINTWLENYKTRWYNKQYNMSDNLYLASLLGVMYQQLVPLILTLRLRACKTVEAHSYHIREYLASNGMLDEYLDFMTKKQALFFYRNINYIERNAGSVGTFNWLLEKVLTDRNIPVSEISLSQSDEALLTEYKPTTRFSRVSINTSSADDNSALAFYTLAELLTKEVNQAPNNQTYIRQNFSEIETKLSRSKTNFLKTKVLESKMIDYTDAGLYSIQDITLDHWCYMSSSGHYGAAINYINKFTNKSLVIPNHIAFLYFLYAYCQINDIEIITVPELYVQRVAIDPLPTMQDLAKVVDKKYVSTEDLEFLRSLHTPMTPVISTTAFTDFLKNTFVSYKAEHMFAATQNDLYKRALIKNATYRLYKAQRVESPFIGQNFIDIFKIHGLQTDKLDKTEWTAIHKEMYEKSTGMDLLLTETQAALQKTMIKLFKKLSSYSIQFLSEINKTTIRSINWSAIRMGDISRYGYDFKRIQLAVIKVFDLISHSSDLRYIELKNFLQKFYVWSQLDIGFVDATIDAWACRPVVNYQLNINNLAPNLQNLKDCKISKPEQLLEFSTYYALTEQEKRDTRDIYQNKVSDKDEIPVIDIDSLPFIPKDLTVGFVRPPVNALEGFNYTFIPDSFELRVEREFLDLDAYESNFGRLDVKAFKPFKGVLKDTLGFKLTPGPIESVVKSFKYTGGILYNPGFGFSLNTEDDKDIGDFIFIAPPSVDTGSMQVLYDKQILTLVYGQGNLGAQLGSYSLVNDKQTLANFNLVMDKQTIDMGTLAAGNTQLAFKLTTNGTARIKLTYEIVNYPSVTLDDQFIDTGSYSLDNFKIVTESVTLDFNLATTHDLANYFFQNDTTEISFKGFVKDSQQLSKFNFSTGVVNLGEPNFELITQEINGFVMPPLKQELGSFKLPKLKQELSDFIFYNDTRVLSNFSFPVLSQELESFSFDNKTHQLGEYQILIDQQELGSF